MPKLKPIVKYINDQLAAGAFSDKRFQGSLYHGIAESKSELKDDNLISWPVIDDKAITPDDKHPLIIYHRIASTAVVAPPREQFGRGNTVLQRTARMQMLIIGMSKRISLGTDEIDLMVMAALPDKLDADSLKNLSLKSCSINVAGSVFHSQSVYVSEFPGIAKPLPPNAFMLQVNYTIGCTFDAKCINPLCCP